MLGKATHPSTTRLARRLLIGAAAITLATAGSALHAQPARAFDEVNDRKTEAFTRLKEASRTPVRVDLDRGFPRAVLTRVRVDGDGPVARARSYLGAYLPLYGQTDRSLTLDVDRVQGEAVVFQQRFHGVPVEGGQLTVYLAGSTVVGTVGSLLEAGAMVDTQPAIAADTAADRAGSALGRRGASVAGVPTLVILDRGMLDGSRHDPRLAWRLVLEGGDPSIVFVDAHDGSLLTSIPLHVDAFDAEIHDAKGANSEASACYWLSSSVQIGDENGLWAAGAGDADASAALSTAHGVYDFYKTEFGRNSWNGWGAEIRMYVHSNTPGTARWNPDCDLFEFTNGSVVPDIAAHEFTHAVITTSSDLVYKGEPGALNESYADVFGSLYDGNWTMGETMAGGAFRSLANPPLYGDPDRLSSPLVATGAGDNYGVHTNSGIPNKAAYLIAKGGAHNGYSITGIGTAGLGGLAYATMTTLPSWPTFEAAAWATYIQAQAFAADGDYSFTDWDVCQVGNAYTAVEMADLGDADCDGTPDTSEADADNDGTGDGADNCPHTANVGQTDMDGDGIGDACDPDLDGDQVPNATDNCVKVYNPGQGDWDNDGVGNKCEDVDHDGVTDLEDDCPNAYDPAQADKDGDGVGDACDSDADGDGVPNIDDNCWLTKNPDQKDTDGGGLGDACDPWPDSPLNDMWRELMAPFHVTPTPEINRVLLKICAVDGCGPRLPDPSIFEAVLDGLTPESTPVLHDAYGRRVPAEILTRGRATVLRFRAHVGDEFALTIKGKLDPFTLLLSPAETH